jgi:hypothetical protein
MSNSCTILNSFRLDLHVRWAHLLGYTGFAEWQRACITCCESHPSRISLGLDSGLR